MITPYIFVGIIWQSQLRVLFHTSFHIFQNYPKGERGSDKRHTIGVTNVSKSYQHQFVYV